MQNGRKLSVFLEIIVRRVYEIFFRISKCLVIVL